MGDLDPQLDRFLRNSLLWAKGCIWPHGCGRTTGDHSSRVLRRFAGRYTDLVGAHTNIQDGAVVHWPMSTLAKLGLGHRRPQRRENACEIGNECLIGMNCTIFDGAQIGAQSVVGAVLWSPRHTDSPGSLVKQSRQSRPPPRANADSRRAQKYVDNAAYCLKHNLNIVCRLYTGWTSYRRPRRSAIGALFRHRQLSGEHHHIGKNKVENHPKT